MFLIDALHTLVDLIKTTCWTRSLHYPIELKATCIINKYFKLGNYEYMEVTLIWLVQMSALLADVGLNIREAHVFSTTDGYSLDVFVVDGWHSEVKLEVWLVIPLLFWWELWCLRLPYVQVKLDVNQLFLTKSTTYQHVIG